MIHRKFNSPKLAMTALVLLGLSFVTAIPTSVQAQGATTEDFEAGYTLGQDVGTHADWYDGGDGPHVTAGDGVAGSVGLAPAPNIFTWTAHPFDWNDPGFVGVNLQMDFQSNSEGTGDIFNDDRIGWMIYDDSPSSDHIFGIQFDDSDNKIEGYWDGVSVTDRRPLIATWSPTRSTWYRLRAEITKLSATSASIDVTVDELNPDGSIAVANVATGSIANTSLLGDDAPNLKYFTASTIWPAYKNYQSSSDGAADNAHFEVVTQHTLTVNVVGSGSVSKDPDQALYDLDDVVELTAVADPGWEFSHWSDDLAGSTNPDNITITGDMNVTATFIELPPSTMTCEDFESGFTLGQDVGTHADWFDGGNGPHVTGGIGVASSVGLAPGNNIFTWTAHPFDWNDPGFVGVNLQMDFQADASGNFDDDRIGWMITDGDVGSSNIFGLQLDPGGTGPTSQNIEAYWDGDTFGDDGGRTSIVNIPDLTNNGWYRFRAEITKLTATSASIDVTLTALDGAGNEGAVIVSDGIADTDLLPGNEVPNPGYFTASSIWPAYKNYTGVGAADNACFEFLTGVPAQHTLTVNVVGNGSVSKDPDQALYNLDDVVELTAAADPGWEFSHWSVDLAGSANPDNITITGDMNVTATFVEVPTSEKFAFVVISDSRTQSHLAGFGEDMLQIQNWVGSPTPDMPAPEFLVFVGDFDHTFETDSIIGDKLGSAYPWYPIIGNHEIDVLSDFTECRDVIFPTLPGIVNSGPPGSVGTNYSWDYENAHFVSVNCYWDGTTGAGADYATDGDVPPALRNWVDTDFAATSQVHKFAFVHEPAYPEVRHIGESLDAYPANRDDFVTMLDDNGVEAFFVGHDHYYHHDVASEHPLLGDVHQVDAGQIQGPGSGGDGSTILYILVEGNTVTYKAYRSTTGMPFALHEEWMITQGAPAQYTLTVNTVGSGSVYKLPDQASYDLSDVVQLTADPNPGWVFDGWSGDLTGSTNPENITITGDMNVTATFVESAPPSMTCEDFESGFTLGQDVGNHAQWFDGADDGGSDVLAAIGVTSSIGLAPGNTIFTWTAHPFDWNAADFQAIVLEMDFQADASGDFDDDRMGWMITDSDNGSTNIFGVQLDMIDGGIVTYWRNSIDTRIQVPIVALSGITANTWYRFYAQITRQSATSASIDVTLTELDGSGNPAGVVASGSLANTDSFGADMPDTKYFTAATMWPAYKNYEALVGAADNACFGIVTGTPPTQHTLTVTTVGNGSVDKVPDQALYYLGSSVQLTANADPGWVFDSWSGDLTGSTNPDNITITGDINITATFVEQPPFTEVCEDFEAGYTLDAQLRTHSDWFYEAANSGPVPQAGIGVAGSIGLTNGDRAFAWTAHPFNWNDPSLDGVYFQMDCQTDGAGHFDDDRVGWTISNTDDNSDYIFGVQMDPKGSSTTVYNIEAYWDGDTFGDNGGRSSIVDLPTLSGNSWYRLRAEIYKLTAGSARIEVTLTALDGAGNESGVVASGVIPNTALLPNTTDEEIPNPAYFTAGSMWPVYKNYDAVAGAVDNTCFGILTGTPPTQHTLTVTTVGNGLVTKDPDQALYDFGDVVELTAVADLGWKLSHWSGDLAGDANPENITIIGDMSVTATFVEASPIPMVCEDFESGFAIGSRIGTHPDWFDGGLGPAVLADAGVNGSVGLGTSGFPFTWTAQPFDWNDPALLGMNIQMDFQTSGDGLFPEPWLGWTIAPAGSNTSDIIAFKLHDAAFRGYWDGVWIDRRMYIADITGTLIADTWYRFRAGITKLTATSAQVDLVLTELDANGDPIAVIATAQIENTSLLGTNAPDAKYFTAGTMWPVYKGSSPVGGPGSDNACFEVLMAGGVNRAPYVVCPDDALADVGDELSATVTATDPDGDDVTITAEDLMAGATFDGNTVTWTPGCDDIGEHIVRFIASDGELADSCYWAVDVVDPVSPVVTCPADLTVECGESIDPAQTGLATATDNCDESPEVSYEDGPVAGGAFVRTWTATDASGNVSEPCEQTITIDDTTSPIVTCPADITVECGESMEPAQTGLATATDICDESPEVSYEDGPVVDGIFTRTWTATDDAANVSEPCVQTITIEDTTPPIVTCPADIAVECGEPMEPDHTGLATAADICDEAPEVSYEDGPVVDGIFTRTWTATDDAANVSEPCLQTITIEDTTPPIVTCPADIMVPSGASTHPDNTGYATATDACDGDPTVDYFDTQVENEITRTWTATDASANISEPCIQTITIHQGLWSAIIHAEGQHDDYATYAADVLVGVAEQASTVGAPPDPVDYTVLLKLYQPDGSGPYSEDIRTDGLQGYRWVIAINPHGNVPPATDRCAMMSWNPAGLSPIGYYLLVDLGLDGTGDFVVVPDMRTTTEYEVCGLDQTHYYAMLWQSSEFCIDLELSAGWQLVSLPLVPDVTDLASLFPGNLAGWAYDSESRQYEPVTEFQPCEGYWLNMESAVTITICGEPLADCSNTLTAGWHLVGGPDCPVTPATIPDGCLTAAWGYNTGTEAYEVATEFSPSLGYWVKLSAECDLILDCAGKAAGKTNGEQLACGGDDASGHKITLSAFGADIEGAKQADVIIGIDSLAHTYPAAPAPPAYTVKMELYQPDWSGPFFEDVRQVGLDTIYWIIALDPHGNVNPPQARSASIKWEPSEFGEEHYFLREGYDGTGPVVVEDMKAVDQYGIIGTQGDHYFTLVCAPCEPTGVEDGETMVPLTYHLEQCYPNPFNPTAQIEFGIPVGGHVELAIYNITGQKIVSLIDGQLDAGDHIVRWNGRDSNGQPVATGVYLYRLRAGTFDDTRKMILLK